MMDYETLRGALQNMTMFVPDWAICQSCGHEHNCKTEGCAVLKEAIATMEQLYKDCEGSCSCCTYVGVAGSKPPCDGCFSVRYHGDIAGRNWQWRGVQKEATP